MAIETIGLEEGDQIGVMKNATPSELIDADGQPVDFKEFNGKVVFVNNWASWCPPCIAEMPTIEKLKKAMPSEEVAFVMVSFDRNPNKGIRWMKNKGFGLPVYFMGENFPRQFITDAIPATFVLDRDGKLLYSYLGMADYSSEAFKAKMKGWVGE